jgi:type IV secretory pathway component VirB8
MAGFLTEQLGHNSHLKFEHNTAQESSTVRCHIIIITIIIIITTITIITIIIIIPTNCFHPKPLDQNETWYSMI